MLATMRECSTWAQAIRPGRWVARRVRQWATTRGAHTAPDNGQEIIQMMIVLIVVVLALLPFLGDLTKALENGFNAIVSIIQNAVNGGAN